MDKTEEEPTYQYLTLKNGEGQYNIQDFLTMPEGTSNNKQIFYLTFNGNNDEENKEEISGQDDSVEEDNLEFGGTDVKLITLDDGQVFLASDNNIYSSNSCTSFIDQGEEEQESLDIAQLSNAEEPLDENSEVSYQLVELEDGSEAVIKIIKIKNDSIKNEPPKKIKRFHCEFEGCEKVYGSSYHLTVHMRSHTDDKPYPCVVDGCEKSFSTNYSLKAHIRTHTGEKPYACVICTKPFKTSGDLQKHVRIHTGEKPFECPVFGCGKAFTTSNIRKVHIRSHTGERPYSCSYLNCGKAFTSSTNYKNHLRIHSGEKPYVCAVEGCGKRFTEYSSLYKHNAIHQPVRLHVCIFCGRRFKQESALNFHKRLKHNVVVTKDGTEIIVKIE